MSRLPGSFADPRVPLRRAVDRVPAGRWGVAVSGGADSVACLHLLLSRAARAADLGLVVIHLDHEMRGAAARADAEFVADLARAHGVPLVLRRRSELESASPADQAAAVSRDALGANLAAKLRWMRLGVYRDAVRQHALEGVILAHHADDVAETILLRLLRGSPASGTLGLAPLRDGQVVGGVRLLRPLLDIRRSRLRRFLERTGRAWREDASNELDITLRNRLRRLLSGRGEVTERLLDLAHAAASTEEALDRLTPALAESPRIEEIAGLAGPVRRRAMRRWLIARGLPEVEAGPRAVERLLRLCDAAGPRAADFAAGLRICRKKGRLQAICVPLPPT